LTVIPAISTSLLATLLGLVNWSVDDPEELFAFDAAEPKAIAPPLVLALVRFEELLEPPPIVEALLAPLRSEELLGPAAIVAFAAPVRSDELLGPPPIEDAPLPLG